MFFGLGFETTMPSTALTVLEAEHDGIGNFSVFCNHITIVPTIKAILDSPDLRIDGFLGPGHVSMVIGTVPYEFVAGTTENRWWSRGSSRSTCCSRCGWCCGRSPTAARRWRTNMRAWSAPAAMRQRLRAIATVYELREFFEWRGLGSIDYSGIRFRDAYARFDAERRFAVPGARIADPLSCQCGEVLKGVLKPHQCKVYGTACTPETPLGALMVSSEGACAAYYRYAAKAA